MSEIYAQILSIDHKSNDLGIMDHTTTLQALQRANITILTRQARGIESKTSLKRHHPAEFLAVMLLNGWSINLIVIDHFNG